MSNEIQNRISSFIEQSQKEQATLFNEYEKILFQRDSLSLIRKMQYNIEINTSLKENIKKQLLDFFIIVQKYMSNSSIQIKKQFDFILDIYEEIIPEIEKFEKIRITYEEKIEEIKSKDTELENLKLDLEDKDNEIKELLRINQQWKEWHDHITKREVKPYE